MSGPYGRGGPYPLRTPGIVAELRAQVLGRPRGQATARVGEPAAGLVGGETRPHIPKYIWPN